MDLFLQGAPFGFTPFCDNNKDMEGFRFWKQGFWKEHLRGKPYHISALFVVDLARFRSAISGCIWLLLDACCSSYVLVCGCYLLLSSRLSYLLLAAAAAILCTGLFRRRYSHPTDSLV